MKEEVVAVACTWDVAPGLGLKRWGEGEGVVIHCKWHLRIWIHVVLMIDGG